MWHRTGDKQAGITLVCIGIAPSIKARPPNPESKRPALTPLT
jgi:hypothetical protein